MCVLFCVFFFFFSNFSHAGFRPQPPLPGIGDRDRNTRGLSANLEDADMSGKARLTPLGQEAQLQYDEEKPKKKKKKKKEKWDAEDDEPYVKESANL